MKHLLKKSNCVIAVIVFIILCFQAIKVNAEPITRLSAIQGLHSLKKFYSIPNFRIGGKYQLDSEADYEYGGTGGVTLESLGISPLRTAYIVVGTPKRNDAGKIINAVVINSYHSGDSTNMYYYWYEGQEGTEFSKGAVVGPGRLIDTERYYVIFVDGLGLWGASKPSDGLGMKFPNYSYHDMVQVNYRLLKDELGVAKVKLTTGVSLGGSLCYSWAILHPDFVEAIIPIGGNSSPDPVARWTFRLMTEGVKSDPVWQRTKGDYYHLPKEEHPQKGLMFGWSILNHTAFDFNYVAEQSWDDIKGNVFSWNPRKGEGADLEKRAKDFDANDVIIRNRTCDEYNIDEQLGRIKAKTLVIHVTNDQWLIYKTIEQTARKIKGAQMVGFESPLAHYAIFQAPNVVKKEVISFFKETGMVPGEKESGPGKAKSLFEK